MSDEVTEKDIQKRWGTEAQYYGELERFIKQHHGAGAILTYHNKWNVPVKAEYYFQPYACYVEHVQLLQKLAEECKDD